MTYKDLQRKLQVQKLRYKHPEIFNRDIGGGSYDKYTSLSFVLFNGINNLYPKIQSNVISYFEDHNIAWWGDNLQVPSGHMLSSQIQCLNFLFTLRNDQNAVLKLAQLFDKNFDAVWHIPGDNEPAYLSFEFVYDNQNLLNEVDKGAQRGAFCTSVDVFMIATRKGEKVLLPIEWKFTETYLNPENKAMEEEKGKTRQARYNHLIQQSNQLKTPPDMAQSLYYYEPYYELMRQTLLVEQMVSKGLANDYLHILIAPKANTDLFQNSYLCDPQDLVESWKNQLENPNKFQQIDNFEILELIARLPDYSELSNYLELRYH